jgi:cytoskeletal protein RodZ
MTEAIAFGLRLRGLRETRGISLERVAQSTKINIGQLIALESGDVSKWPAGIFARGFVRAYADEVRTAAAPLVAEFCRVFPTVAGSSASPAEHRLRITLVAASRLTRAAAWLTRRSHRPSRGYQPASERSLPTQTTGLRIV